MSMKIIRVLTRIGLGLFIVWGLIALLHRWTHEPAQSRFFFWFVLPYPVLIVLTVFIIATCARYGRPGGTGFSWFAVGTGAASSIGLALAVSTGLSSIISWAYFGHVSLSYAAPTDPKLVAMTIAVSAACYMWAGAVSSTLSPERPLLHAFAAGAVLLLWSCTVTLLMQPIVMSQLLLALVFPVPFAALGARLQQARKVPSHG
jgi:hypothetical protein